MVNIPLLMSSLRSFDSIISWLPATGCRPTFGVCISHSASWSVSLRLRRLAKRFMAQSTVDKARFRMRPEGQNVANFMQNANAFRLRLRLNSSSSLMDGKWTATHLKF